MGAMSSYHVRAPQLLWIVLAVILAAVTTVAVQHWQPAFADSTLAGSSVTMQSDSADASKVRISVALAAGEELGDVYETVDASTGGQKVDPVETGSGVYEVTPGSSVQVRLSTWNARSNKKDGKITAPDVPTAYRFPTLDGAEIAPSSAVSMVANDASKVRISVALAAGEELGDVYETVDASTGGQKVDPVETGSGVYEVTPGSSVQVRLSTWNARSNKKDGKIKAPDVPTAYRFPTLDGTEIAPSSAVSMGAADQSSSADIAGVSIKHSNAEVVGSVTGYLGKYANGNAYAQDVELVASVQPANATEKGVSWSVISGGDNITLSDNGSGTATITPKAVGTATLRATATGDTTKYKECAIEVKAVAVQSASLNYSNMSLDIGEARTLSATVSPNTAYINEASWSSSNESVATVADGVVTAVAEGSATIAFTAGGKTASCEVEISGNQAAKKAAEVGGVQYDTLGEALESANGGTVKLLRNATVSEELDLPSCTLDLNGFALAAAAHINIPNGATVTIKNGKIENADSAAVFVSGELKTLEDVSVKNGSWGLNVQEGGSVGAINNCAFTGCEYGINIVGTVDSISGCEINVSIDGVTTQGSRNGGGVVGSIAGTKIVAGGVAVYIKNYADDSNPVQIAVTSGTFETTGTYAIRVSGGGVVKIDDALIKASTPVYLDTSGDRVAKAIYPDGYKLSEGVNESGYYYLTKIDYAVSKASCVNGSFTVSKETANMGDEVSVTPSPNDGYAVDAIAYTPEGGSAIDVTSAAKFTMPACNVTVTVTFKTKAKEVEDIISALPDAGDIKAANADDVSAALDAYLKLTAEQKASVPATSVAKLLSAQNAVVAIAQKAADEAKAAAGAAEAAQARAESAQQKAESDLADAKAAQQAAEADAATAKGEAADAKAAQQKAESDLADAQAAQQKAESDAKEAKAEAETAKQQLDQAESDLADAKDAQQKAEAAAESAKSAQEKAEADAKTAKDEADAAKAAQAKAEDETAKAKAAQKAAEAGKVTLAKPKLTAKTKSAKKGKVTVAWGKVAKATGYEVKVGVKIYTVKKASTLKKTVKAAKGKKVKVRVRAYAKQGKNYVYSAWSAAKAVKVKK